MCPRSSTAPHHGALFSSAVRNFHACVSAWAQVLRLVHPSPDPRGSSPTTRCIGGVVPKIYVLTGKAKIGPPGALPKLQTHQINRRDGGIGNKRIEIRPISNYARRTSSCRLEPKFTQRVAVQPPLQTRLVVAIEIVSQRRVYLNFLARKPIKVCLCESPADRKNVAVRIENIFCDDGLVAINQTGDVTVAVSVIERG